MVCEVEWRTHLTGLQNDEEVRAKLSGPDGTEQTVCARWLIGCDGGGAPFATS